MVCVYLPIDVDITVGSSVTGYMIFFFLHTHVCCIMRCMFYHMPMLVSDLLLLAFHIFFLSVHNLRVRNAFTFVAISLFLYQIAEFCWCILSYCWTVCYFWHFIHFTAYICTRRKYLVMLNFCEHIMAPFSLPFYSFFRLNRVPSTFDNFVQRVLKWLLTMNFIIAVV